MTMTLEELAKIAKEAAWFQCLTLPDVTEEFVRISNLAPWANQSNTDPMLDPIADEMSWLPSTRDQLDPIHGETLERRVEENGKKVEFAPLILDLQKTAIISLRSFVGHPALQIGPHDFTEAARGAALYAVRRAAYEALLGEPGSWCRLMRVYDAGHWPCGILDDGRVVVL
jgi:hypothetical protein